MESFWEHATLPEGEARSTMFMVMEMCCRQMPYWQKCKLAAMFVAGSLNKKLENLFLQKGMKSVGTRLGRWKETVVDSIKECFDKARGRLRLLSVLAEMAWGSLACKTFYNNL
jgi:hypothetical protein